MPDALPSRIRELLEKRLNSFTKLHLALTLVTVPDQVLSFESLCTALRELPERTREIVEEGREAGLVELSPGGAVTLVTTPPELDLLAELERLNESEPTLVARFLSESSIRRIRSLAVRALLDDHRKHDDD